jgi:hypothetical protein
MKQDEDRDRERERGGMEEAKEEVLRQHLWLCDQISVRRGQLAFHPIFV